MPRKKVTNGETKDLKVTNGAVTYTQAIVKNKHNNVERVYSLEANGADFAELAKEYTSKPGRTEFTVELI